MRVVTLGDWESTEPVVEYGVWGSNLSQLRNWSLGETVVIFIKHDGVIVGQVSGPGHEDERVLWEKDLFGWKIPLSSLAVYKSARGRSLNEAIRSVLKEKVGPMYGYVLHNQSRLNSGVESLVKDAIVAAGKGV